MEKEREELIMSLIVDAGSARSYAMQAIYLAKENKIEEAKQAIQSANEEMSRAHSAQTSMIQKEAGGDKTQIDLFMVHAQDHVMTAMLAKDLAQEIVILYEKMNGMKK